MAAVDDDGGFDDASDFDEYNPHPYAGGYDIALTYGKPLTPSSSICYPVSPPASGPAPPSSPAPAAPTSPPPAPVPAPIPAPAPVSEPVNYPPYDYGEGGYRPEPYSPDLFRSWHILGCGGFCRRGEVKEYDYWNQLMRGLDYLFGHAQGYGERRVGIDRYGVPIYANKKSSSESVAVEIEPPRTEKLDFFYTRGGQVYPEEENYRYGEPVSDSIARYQEWGSHDESFSHYGQKEEESNFFGKPIYSFDRYYSEQPLTVQIQPVETAWAQKFDSYESFSQYDQREEDNNFFGIPTYSYDRYHSEQPLSVQIQPGETAWVQNFDSYENNSPYEERGKEGHMLEMSDNAYEQHSIAQPDYVQLEPFKPSWSQNLDYYQAYDEGVSHEPNYRSNYYDGYEEPISPISNWQSSSFEEQGVVSSFFSSSDYAQEKYYSEQPQGDQLEAFEPSWTDPSYYDIFKVDDSNHKNDGQFQQYPEYSVWE